MDTDNNTAANYEYDPYGKVISATGTLAEVNPIRYRGYYYDSETGFYYLQSRYYDPTTCRFINTDSYASTGQGIVGYNMFAYCNNSPDNFKDINGQEPITITLSAAGVATVAILAVGIVAASYCAFNVIKGILTLLDDLVKTAWGEISFAKKEADPEPPDVTYPGDDPKTAPDGYEWRGPDEQGGKRGGYANPDGKDSWHPDLDHPDGIKPHWDYNDGLGHKWRVFPDHIELVIN